MNETVDYYDGITSFRESLHIVEKVSAFISALLTFISLCLLSTCLSKQCRAVSAVWYIYFLLVVVVFYGLILCIGMSSPVFYWTDGCVFLHSFFQMMQLLYSSTVFWINIEVFRTIISPKASWMKTKFRRFCVVIGITCGVSLSVVILTGVVSFYYGCPIAIVEGVVHLLKNWIPGVLVIIMCIINIVSYVRLRRQGLITYNQVADNTSVTINPSEWFLCAMLINAIYIIFELLFLHISISVLASKREPFIAMRFIERLMLICMGYPILVLSMVRQIIVKFFRARPCGNRLDKETENDRCDLDMDAFAENSL